MNEQTRQLRGKFRGEGVEIMRSVSRFLPFKCQILFEELAERFRCIRLLNTRRLPIWFFER